MIRRVVLEEGKRVLYITRFRCAVCGKLTAGRKTGRGTDGTARYARKHDAIRDTTYDETGFKDQREGEPCIGSVVEAEWVEERIGEV